MYNPSGTDSNHEWIEIYNNDSDINITGWKFRTGSSDHTFNIPPKNGGQGNMIILAGGYVIICQNAETFLNDYPNHTGTVIDSSWSDISNIEETIAIKDNNENFINNLTYNGSFGIEGNSLQLINETWYAAAPTPGYVNSIQPEEEEDNEEEAPVSQDIKLEVYLDDEIYANVQYTKLFKLVNANPEFGKIYNITVNYNITKDSQLIKEDFFIKDEINTYSTTSTGSFIASEAGNYTLCGIITSSTANDTNQLNDKACKTITVIDTSSFPCNISINTTTDKTFYLDNETVKFYNNLNDESFPYVIEYWVEDLFGNILKKKINTTNTDQKSYSPRISEQDLVLLIKNQLYVLCNDSNISDNSAEMMIIIKNTNPQFLSTEENSSLEIIDIYDLGSDNKAKFGQAIRVKLDIRKGDTAKNSISLWIEDNKGNKVSKESNTNVYQKYMDYKLTLPLQIKPNCDYSYDDGIYKLIIEGLDEKDSKNIEIEGITKDLCEKTEIEKIKQTTGSLTYTITDAPEEVFSGEEFTIQLSLKNDDNERHDAAVWSYIYRGNKCYCKDREENKQEVSIAPEKEEIVTLKNKVIEAEPGDYKLKISIIKDNQKTVRELTREIKVITPTESLAQSFFQNQPSTEINLESEKHPKIVYESTNIKTQKLIPIFIIALLAILSAILIWKR